MMNVKGNVINILRRIVDKYDDENGLKKKKLFMCTGADRRNEKRREAFRIPLDKPQCPTYKDNRCCGCCDLMPTCDYTTNCNCYGIWKGSLGGTEEGYYMREDDNAKYGRIGTDGEFDWGYYYLNRYSERFTPGKYIPIRKLEKTNLSEDIKQYLDDRGIVVGKIVSSCMDDSSVLIDFTESNNGENFQLSIKAIDIAHSGSYDTFDEAKFLNMARKIK